jgi:protein-S-isoprenylcysteine O-methyltransferase Ste14
MMNENAALAVIAGLWGAWLLAWLVAALGQKPTLWREPLGSEMRHRLPLLAAALLLAVHHRLPALLTQRFLPRSGAGDTLGILLVLGGLGFAVWARWYLGANWSSAVTVKESHTLIRTGPYRHVRHPIYSGLLLALCGTAIVIGEVRAVLAVALAFLALLYKSRIEEARMRASFPEYDAYRRETAALIPFLL